MRISRQLVLAAVGSFVLSAAGAQSSSTIGHIKDPFGYSVPESQAERTVQIGSKTRVVNVTRMETNRFVINDVGVQKSIAWRFDVLPRRAFSLDELAPAGGMASQQVTVYVASNRYLDGGGR